MSAGKGLGEDANVAATLALPLPRRKVDMGLPLQTPPSHSSARETIAEFKMIQVESPPQLTWWQKTQLIDRVRIAQDDLKSKLDMGDQRWNRNFNKRIPPRTPVSEDVFRHLCLIRGRLSFIKRVSVGCADFGVYTSARIYVLCVSWWL